MKTLASISAVLCTIVLLAIALPRSSTPDVATHRAAVTVPSRPADFQSGQTGATWWTGRAKAGGVATN